jgi:3-hydroxyacyl-[acyl-carrier-protein] dehydratase
MPGVLVIEALAQCGAILALREIQDRDQKLVLFTGIREARFRKPVVPGDTLTLEVTALRFGPRIQRMRGEAKVDGQLCADAELTSVIADRPSRNHECSVDQIHLHRFILLPLSAMVLRLAVIVRSARTRSSVKK